LPAGLLTRDGPRRTRKSRRLLQAPALQSAQATHSCSFGPVNPTGGPQSTALGLLRRRGAPRRLRVGPFVPLSALCKARSLSAGVRCGLGVVCEHARTQVLPFHSCFGGRSCSPPSPGPRVSCALLRVSAGARSSQRVLACGAAHPRRGDAWLPRQSRADVRALRRALRRGDSLPLLLPSLTLPPSALRRSMLRPSSTVSQRRLTGALLPRSSLRILS